MLILVFSVVLIHNRSQNRLLKQREKAREMELQHQKHLLNAVITSQEAERKRIGQDLHDDMGAALSSLRLMIDMYKPVHEDVLKYQAFNENCKGAIDEIIVNVRHIAHHLSPSLLSLRGLTAALNKQLDFINHAISTKAVVSNEAEDVLANLDLPTATALYRVLEELLNNTIKHAKATSIQIEFSLSNDVLMISYQDNGIGLPKGVRGTAAGMGLRNIESRLSLINASYEIAEPARGFQLRMFYPLKTIIAHAPNSYSYSG